MMLGLDEMDSTCTSSECTSDSEQEFKKTDDMRGITIGIPKEYRNELLPDDSIKVWNEAIDLFSSMGATIKAVSLPHTDYSIVCYYILADSDVASNMARYDGIRFGYRDSDQSDSFNEMIAQNRTASLNDVVRRRIFSGNFYNIKESRGRYYDQAAKVRRLIKRDFEQAFSCVDALLTPTTAHSAPLLSEVKNMDLQSQRRDDYFTQPANMCGLPAVSVPFSKSSNGLPLGIQIICAYGQDKFCLALAERLKKS